MRADSCPFYVRSLMKDSKNYEIGPMFCGEEGHITIRSLTGLMLDISTIQANRVEKNLKFMDNKVWLLYSWDIEISKPIKEGCEIKITTIPTHNMKRFFAYRNFIVENHGGILAKAKAAFILFDKVKQRAAIIDKDVIASYGESPEIYEGRPYEKVDDFEVAKEISIRRADFDKNHHVNNGIYFDYIKEIPGLDEEKISYIKMIYKNQIKNEEKVGLFYKKGQDKIDFKIGSEIDHAYGMVEYV